jgi:hypothetical protein
MRLIHTTTDDGFIFMLVSQYAERHVPARLGFIWNRIVAGAWATINLATARLAAIEPGMTADKATVRLLLEREYLTSDEAANINQSPASRKDEAAIIGLQMTDEVKAAVHHALRMLAGVCDGAVQQDGIGFNGQDTQFGHELAAAASLTNMQAAYGKLMLRKYHGQLGDEVMQAIWPEDVAEAQRIEAAKATARAEKAAAKEQKQDTKEAASMIKKAAGRGKATPEVVAVLARLAMCGIDEFDALVEELKRLRVTAAQLDTVTTDDLQQAAAPNAAAMPLSNERGRLYCTKCGVETPVVTGGGNLSGRLCGDCRKAEETQPQAEPAQAAANFSGQVAADVQSGVTTHTAASTAAASMLTGTTEIRTNGCTTCGSPVINGQPTCDHKAAKQAAVDYGASVEMTYDPAPVVERAKEAVAAVLETPAAPAGASSFLDDAFGAMGYGK